MDIGTQHKTVLTAQVVLSELYRMNRETDFFECELIIEVPREDDIETITRVIFVDRIDDTVPPAYRHPNGDYVFDTLARVEPGGEPFDVSITIPYGVESNVEGALLKISAKIFDLLPK